MTALLFDVGGTNMRIARGADGRVDAVRTLPTPARPEDAIAALAAYASEGVTIEIVSGGIAGVIENGAVRKAPHLPGWDGFSMQRALEAALGVPARVRNDAELAALGEAVHGAGKGARIVAYVGIGTGVGGALVVDGLVAPHASGFEPGHQVIDLDTGATLEGIVSGSALASAYGVPAHEVPGEAYRERAHALAVGLYNAVLEWSPEVLVLGGSLMNEEDGYRLDEVRAELAAIPTVLPALPEVRHALLGDENGLYGALASIS
jgi:predicted NBD/HSP70 family sugar kinase